MVSATGSSRPVCVTVPIEPRCCSASLFPSAVRASAADGKVLPVVETDGPAGDDPLSAPHRRAVPELQRPRSAKAFSRPAPGCPGRAAAKKSRTPTPSPPLALFHSSLHHGLSVFMKSPPLPKRPAVSRSDPFRGRGGKAALFCRPAKRGTWKKRPIKSSCRTGAPFTGVFYGPAAVTKSRRRHKNWPGEDIASRAGKTRALYGRRSAPTSSSKGRTGQTRLTDITDAIPTREAV